MSISGVLGRFLAVYVVLVICAGFAIRYFGITSNSGVNVGILIGAVMWSCTAFGMKNKRYFTAPEKSKVVWGMIGINLLLQLLIGGAALAAEGKLSVGVCISFCGVDSLFGNRVLCRLGRQESQQATSEAGGWWLTSCLARTYSGGIPLFGADCVPGTLRRFDCFGATRKSATGLRLATVLQGNLTFRRMAS